MFNSIQKGTSGRPDAQVSQLWCSTKPHGGATDTTIRFLCISRICIRKTHNYI